jgi:molecular chaperone DnaJ
MEINIDKGSSGHMVFSGHGHKMHKDVPAGNLVVTVLYRHTKSFNIINQKGDLLTMLAVNPVRAIVGGRCFVKGLDGKRISFELSPGVSEGTKIRIADQGMYLQGSSSRGDLYVQIAFDVPIESGEKKDILLQYLKSTNENYI